MIVILGANVSNYIWLITSHPQLFLIQTNRITTAIFGSIKTITYIDTSHLQKWVDKCSMLYLDDSRTLHCFDKDC